MATLQEHYNSIKNGKGGNKAQFLKQARLLFPEYINQYLDFDTATNVLKSKQIISEAVGGVVAKGFSVYDWKKILSEEAKAEEKKVTKEVEDYNKSNFDNKDMKNADNINFNEIMKGFYCELRDEKNAGKTGDELKDIVVKNLAKDPLYYTKNGEFGTAGVGYTTEAPGLGTPKEPKGKHKSSGYGDLDTEVEKVKANVKDTLSGNEAKTSMPKKVKEMPVAPQNASGVKKMAMPGKEKKIKLYESFSESFLELDDAKEEAERISREEGVVQHVNVTPSGAYKIEDWYDADNTVASYENGMRLNETKDVYQQLEDLQNELTKEKDTERKKELEAKIKALEAGLKENTDSLDQHLSAIKGMSWDEAFDYMENQFKQGNLDQSQINRIMDMAFPNKFASKSKQSLMYKDTDPNLSEPISETKLRSVIQQIIKEELNKTESSVKKGDILYHKNSGTTLEVTDVKSPTVNMKVKEISDKTPEYIKVGQPSKTNLANIGKTYTKK